MISAFYFLSLCESELLLQFPPKNKWNMEELHSKLFSVLIPQYLKNAIREQQDTTSGWKNRGLFESRATKLHGSK